MDRRDADRPRPSRPPIGAVLSRAATLVLAAALAGVPVPAAAAAQAAAPAPAPAAASAQAAGTAADTFPEPPPRELGELDFPTSGDPAAKPWFERGLLLLHSFEYDDARSAFRRAQEIDPDYVMAHWGEAMTHDHPLWRQQDRAAARAALEALAPTREERLAAAGTDRERAYLRAAEILFGDGPGPRRDTLYARAMGELADAHPEDEDARLFHALARLGLSQGERHVPTYVEAGAGALRVFDENSRHPGAAHYTIHAFDDPVHAPLALEAARTYGELAPGAAHARHMTSHVFVALGMWEEVVAANEAAARATAGARGEPGGSLHPCGHYAEWLAYGYLQRGRAGDAGRLIRRCRERARETGDRRAWSSTARMRAIWLVDAPSIGGEIAAWELPGDRLSAWWRTADAFADGLAAARSGDAAAARGALARLEEERAELPDRLDAEGRILATTLRALARRAEGDPEAALEAAREAAAEEAALEVPYGPPGTFLPPRELVGRLLLDLDRPAEARRAFRRALERTPRRPRALAGLARAAAAAGRSGEAERACRELTAIGSAADGGWPVPTVCARSLDAGGAGG